MAYQFNGTTSNIKLASALLSAAPITFAVFGKIVTAAARNIMAIDDGSANNTFRLIADVGGTISAVTNAGGATSTATTTETYPLGSWFAAAAIFGAANSRFAAINGRFSTEQTTSRVPSGVNVTIIGARSSGSQLWLGSLAEAAIWQARLTPNELRRHAEGVPASRIRPEALLLYMPLSGDTVDLGPRQLVLTNTACVPVSDHPRIILPVKHPLRRPNTGRRN